MSVKWISRISRAAVISLMMSATAGVALAQGVGNSPPVNWPINSANTWEIGNAANPVPVVLDPTGSTPWGKLLGDMTNQPFSTTSNPVIPGGTYTLHEYLLVAGNNPWTDWHEDIKNSPGWTWSSATLKTVFGTPVGPIPGVGVGTSNVSFFFSPIAPGSIVEITKTLTYPISPTFYQGYVQVNEYPTGVPEPASLLLISGAGAFLLKRPRRAVAAIN